MEYVIAGALVLIVIGIRTYLWWLRKNDDYWKQRGIPYKPRLSHISFIRLQESKPSHEASLEAYKKLGRIYGEFEFRNPVLCVCDPDLLRDILVKDFHYFSCRKEDNIGEPMFDNMLISLNGEDWKRVRTIITPAFTSKRMRQISHIIKESSETVVENFGKYSDREEPVDCKKIFGAFTMDVIASAAFATKIDSHNDPDNIFVRHVKMGFEPNSVLHIFLLRFVSSWLARKYRVGVLKTLDFFKDVILNVIKQRKQGGNKYNDVLQLLMDAQEEYEKENLKENANELEDEVDHFGSVTSNGVIAQPKYSKLSEDELMAQCALFFIVGYETTASNLAFIAYCLALNSACQEKLIKEVDDVLEKHKELNYDVIQEMKYLDCVVSETLRMYPSLSSGERTAVEDYTVAKTGLVIKKGLYIKYHIHAMHHDPEFFVDPEKFDPERFKAENISHPQYAYLPFGAGPRNCLGMRFALMEIKLCMCKILQHYRFKKAPTTKVPLEFKPGDFMSAKEVSLLIERRKDKAKVAN